MSEVNLQSRSVRKYHGDIALLVSDSKFQISNSKVVFQSSGMVDRFSEILRDYEVNLPRENLLVGNLSSGFEIPSLKTAYQTENDIFGETRQAETQRTKDKGLNRKSGRLFQIFATLNRAILWFTLITESDVLKPCKLLKRLELSVSLCS